MKKGLSFDPRSYKLLAEKVLDALENGKKIADLGIKRTSPDFQILNSFRLLSAKPVLFVANGLSLCPHSPLMNSR